MPIHKGHIHAILEAAKQCEYVYVMLCTRLCEPIDGNKREKWIKSIFKDNDQIIIVHCKDDLPQYPEDDINFWHIWNEVVHSRVPDLDAVFGSEEYINPFAWHLGVEPILVDINRKTVSVSATDIRTDPFGNWEHIPKVVKEEYRLKIAIVGPESTGKSTLCDQLADHYDGIRVEEYGRWYTENRVDPKNLKPEDFDHIASEHHQMMLMSEYESAKKGSKYVFMDTEAIVTRTFLSMYEEMHGWYKTDVGEDVTYYMEKIDSLMKLQMFGHGYNKSGMIDLYLLTYPDLDWEDDGNRDFGEKDKRLLSFLRIKTQLDVNNCRYHIIKGKGDDRLSNAKLLIDLAERDMREKDWHKLSFDR